MMIVSNSSTLILLAKISALKTFLDNYGKIIIPEQVYKEITRKDSFDSLIIRKEIGNTIEIKKINKDINEIKKQFRLDDGEAAAYALYNDGNYKCILTDDRELIKLCKLDNIAFICAIAILLQLYKKKKISKQDFIEKIQKLENVGRYSKEIIDYFKSEV